MNKPANIPRQLQSYATVLLHGGELYRILAKSAPSEQERRQLEDYSRECNDTSQRMTELYRQMTGYPFEPRPMPVNENGSFRSVVKRRIAAELKLGQSFREDYLMTRDHYRLRRAFFTAYHQASDRAIGLINMLIPV